MTYDDEVSEEESVCPGCGLPQSQFVESDGRGFVSKAGDLYCCRDCSEGRLCQCRNRTQMRSA